MCKVQVLLNVKHTGRLEACSPVVHDSPSKKNLEKLNTKKVQTRIQLAMCSYCILYAGFYSRHFVFTNFIKTVIRENLIHELQYLW